MLERPLSLVLPSPFSMIPTFRNVVLECAGNTPHEERAGERVPTRLRVTALVKTSDTKYRLDSPCTLRNRPSTALYETLSMWRHSTPGPPSRRSSHSWFTNVQLKKKSNMERSSSWSKIATRESPIRLKIRLLRPSVSLTCKSSIGDLLYVPSANSAPNGLGLAVQIYT